MRVKVGSRYQITLSVDARKRLGIMPGDDLLLEVRDNCLILMPEPQDPAEWLRGVRRRVRQDTVDHPIVPP